jgi:hypothetical protein
LQDNDFFGAEQIVVSSASSKTAYGTAFCLKDKYPVKLIALTSNRNRAFVDSLGCYHQSATYDHLATIAQEVPTLYLDFSGDEALRSAVHHYFGSALNYDCYAGSAQNTHFLRKTDLPGPEPVFYFAPIQIKKRNIDWGHDLVNQRFNEAQQRFIQRVSDPQDPWMTIVENKGLPATITLIDDMHGGRIDPRKGHVVRLP